MMMRDVSSRRGCSFLNRVIPALATGIVSVEEARALLAQRELVAKVIRVDDFDKDLGASLLQPALDTVRPRPVSHRAAA